MEELKEQIQEIKQRVDRLEEKNNKLETENRKLREKLNEETDSSRKPEDNKMTRRKFLKMLGVGAGGLALSSSVAGSWSLVTPENRGTSDIESQSTLLYKGNDIDTDGDGVVDVADNANALEGVKLSNISWGDLSLSKSDINFSNLGSLDSSLDVGGYDLNNIYDLYSEDGGRVLLRAQGSSGEIGFYDDSTSTWNIRSYNGGKLNLKASNGAVDLSSNSQLKLPAVSSDPSTSSGTIWYRSDLD